MRELQRGSDVGESEWLVAVDSTVVRAHHHAAGAGHARPADVAVEVLTPVLDRQGRPDVEVVSRSGEGTGGRSE